MRSKVLRWGSFAATFTDTEVTKGAAPGGTAAGCDPPIAGRNAASDGSFKAALELAAQLAANRLSAAAVPARKPSEPAA